MGPLPRSKAGSQCLFTMACKSTWHAAAFSLHSITTKPILKILTFFMSTFGVPKVVQTDQGSNFMSHTFSQVVIQLRVEHHVASAYHPQSQGALDVMSIELPQDWEEDLPWLLLAVREISQASTCFSPNELVFGHTVQGPLAVLGANLKPGKPPEDVLDYVNGFRRRLHIACASAHGNLSGAQGKMKGIFDQKAETHQFELGHQVLALLPEVGSPFQARFSGPFTVKSRMSDRDYLIFSPKRRKKVQWCHVNLFKPFLASSDIFVSLFRYTIMHQHEHDTDVGEALPVRQSAYRLPVEKRDHRRK